MVSNQTDSNKELKVFLEIHVEDFKHGFKLKKILSKNDIELIFNQ